MKTALTLLTATVVPGGFIILAIGFAAYLLARRRGTPAANPAVSQPLIAGAFTRS